MSMSPGIIHLPRASTTLASFGVCNCVTTPTSAIRSPRITTMLFSTTLPLRTSTKVAPTIAVLGRVDCTDCRELGLADKLRLSCCPCAAETHRDTRNKEKWGDFMQPPAQTVNHERG